VEEGKHEPQNQNRHPAGSRVSVVIGVQLDRFVRLFLRDSESGPRCEVHRPGCPISSPARCRRDRIAQALKNTAQNRPAPFFKRKKLISAFPKCRPWLSLRSARSPASKALSSVFIPPAAFSFILRFICPKCQGRLKVIAFLTDFSVVDRIINHLKLTFVAAKPPPPHIAYQEVLMAAETSAEYFL
jgi:hypothetical protein